MLAIRPVLLFSSFFSIFSLLSQSLTAQGSTCVQAAEITTGNHQTTAITSGNGASHSDAEHAAWYKFVPDRDGLLSVSSCGGGADTRLWVYNGACGALTLVAENDDACDLDSDGGNDNDFASQATLLVEKGNQYFIEWDDKYDNIAFNFNLSFTAALPEGSNCSTAKVLTTGVQQLEGYPVAGNGPKPDATAAVWYSYTPEQSGLLSISSCNQGVDTRLSIWEGNCDNLKEVTSIDDACDIDGNASTNNNFAAALDRLPLVGGKTYFIVWDNAHSEGSFDFQVTYLPQVSDCDQPLEVLAETFGSYVNGTALAGKGAWSASSTGTVTESPSGRTGPFEPFLNLSAAAEAKAEMQWDQPAEGHLRLSWLQLLGENSKAKMQLLEQWGQASWFFQMEFLGSEIGKYTLGAESGSFFYPSEDWFAINIDMDWSSRLLTVWIDGERAFSVNIPNGLPSAGLPGISFQGQSSGEWLLDEIYLDELPAPAPAQYCQTAVEIKAGTHTVYPLTCFGGWRREAQSTAWYRFQPDENGYIRVSSCGEPVDTRVWIVQGDCTGWKTLGINDNRCSDNSTGLAFAALREAAVIAGEEYFIVWDNRHSKNGFDFNLEFFEGNLPEGNFCESAIPVTYGKQYKVNNPNGEAAVAGGFLENTATAQSEWYQFTAPDKGFLNVYSCGFPGQDTRLWIYGGTCGDISSLELLASNNDACDMLSAVYNLELEKGQTVYIEWDNFGQDNGSFTFQVEFLLNIATVTVLVDLSQEEIASDGAYVIGDFTNWIYEPMDALGNGMFTFSAPAGVGDTIEYKFRNGTGFSGVENPPAGSDCVQGLNKYRYYVVEPRDTVLPSVCFNACASCQTVGIQAEPLQGEFLLYPNPSGAETYLLAEMPETGEVQIRLVNALGQSIWQQNLMLKGRSRVPLQWQKQTAGFYWVEISDGQRGRRLPLMIK